MREWIAKHSQNAIYAAILSSVLALVVSIGSAIFTYYSSAATQDRQARLEQVSKFDSSSAQLIEAGGAFIAAINESQDLSAARLKLSAVVASQIHDVDSISKFFDQKVNKAAAEYQGALAELNQVAQKTSNVMEMRPWAESFGRALDAKSNLSRSLYSRLGVDVRA